MGAPSGLPSDYSLLLQMFELFCLFSFLRSLSSRPHMLCLFTFLCQSAAICFLPLEFIIISGLPMGFFSCTLYSTWEIWSQVNSALPAIGPKWTSPILWETPKFLQWPPSLSLVWLLDTSVSVCLGFPALLLTHVTLAFLLVPISDTLHTLPRCS